MTCLEGDTPCLHSMVRMSPSQIRMQGDYISNLQQKLVREDLSLPANLIKVSLPHVTLLLGRCLFTVRVLKTSERSLAAFMCVYATLSLAKFCCARSTSSLISFACAMAHHHDNHDDYRVICTVYNNMRHMLSLKIPRQHLNKVRTVNCFRPGSPSLLSHAMQSPSSTVAHTDLAPAYAGIIKHMIKGHGSADLA